MKLRGVIVAVVLMALVVPATASAEYTVAQIKSYAIARAKKIGVVTEEQKKAAKTQTMTFKAASASMTNDDQTPTTEEEMSSQQSATFNSKVVKVTISGAFKDWTAKKPRWAHTPEGTILEQTFDPQTKMRLSVRLWSGHVEGWPTGFLEEGEEPCGSICATAASRGHHHHRLHIGRAHASATWGEGCSRSSHCYATSEWKMPCCSERVRGTETKLDTSTMWMSGADVGAASFIDNEKWDAFQQYENGNGYYWIETGQSNGEGFADGAETMRWFVAVNRGLGYYANESPWIEEKNVWHTYETASALNHIWCAWIDGGNAGCFGGFPVYANDIEVGVEAATAYKPANAMQEWSTAMHTNGGLHAYNWNRDSLFANGGLCVGRYTGAPVYKAVAGDIVAGTC